MPNTSDLLTGLAQIIAAAGLAVFKADGVYAAGQTGIIFKNMPPTPDRIVVLNAVNQGDNITMPLSAVMVQIRGRGIPNRPLDVDDLLDPIFDLLHGATNLTIGGLHITQMNRRVSITNGQDDAKRHERIDQYYLDIDVPPTVNRPEGGSW